LRDNQGAPATLAEGQALDQLQQAARQIGEAAAQAAAGSSGGGRDPLGRALSEGQGVDSDGVKIPSHGDVGKSREILDDLRRRAADLDRPADERAYLRRLLEKLY
jgi:hypothetical protein